MKVSDVISIAKYGELSQLAVAENNEAVLTYINMGILELYKRFNIGTKVEIVKTNTLVNIYTLYNPDIMKVINVYDADGKELTQPTIINSEEYDYKQIGIDTFLFKEPKDEDLAFVYISSPDTLSIDDLDSELILPAQMIEALLHYIGYRGHGSLDGNIQAENNTHYMRFEKSCGLVADSGFGEIVDLSVNDVAKKGFL